MKILITGNMGYVGPGVVSQLRETYPHAELIGFDIAFFAHCLTNPPFLPERKLDKQIFGDVRYFDPEILNDIDSIVYLAAISNDPMGNKFEEVTMDVNYRSAIRMAKIGKEKGVSSFVFASSCSVYGAAEGSAKVESDTLNPLTAYARSKIAAEEDLLKIADDGFTVTCLRFATACGFSNRLRLDLVLNDFVAGAVSSKRIDILSDGTPWRPLINVLDMARAIDWAVTRDADNGGEFLAVNAGTNSWNYQVKELAEAVAEVVEGCKVTINQDAPPDKRSYKVNFDLFKKLAPNHQPIFDLETSIRSLYENLNTMGFNDPDFRESSFIRLKVLNKLQTESFLDDNLSWKWQNIPTLSEQY
ncbi:NAD-dependent epimerase/dehydratase family protein [Maribellus maritimus]|uniref:NAD-dependent epimerase/dehydratase family protein n=1 Tax=Maribellus maritimus TaxID=2870838 RepID=UPI001EEC3BF6|nr:SDR family oxidoreductase [Maribellus maritimus]MCG6190230.1 SDR family oxidoreductase [Maribellus maritimus]